MRTEGYERAKEFYGIILDIIKEGQDEGVIKSDLDIYLARSVIIGGLEHNIIRWLLKDKKYSLLSHADDLVDLFIQMLKSTESDVINDIRPAIAEMSRKETV
jgi:TetR/AcrR family fatty acid metabolism transcriptional regulator